MTSVSPPIDTTLMARKLAFEALLPFEKRFGAPKPKPQKQASPIKADERLNGVLNTPAGQALSDADRRLVTQLVYGTLRYWWFFQRLYLPLSHFPWERVDPTIRLLLRLGGLQLLWLDAIPDYAALDTTVSLAKLLKQPQKSVAFLNAMLRSLQRQQATFKTRYQENPAQWIFPDSLLAAVEGHFTDAEQNAMAALVVLPPMLTLRVNTLKTTVDDYVKVLAQQGIAAEVGPFMCIHLTQFVGNPATLPGYEAGWFMVQDVHAARVASWVDPQPGDTVVDLCAAPGGKTTHMAALMQNQGRLLAVETSAKRIPKLQQNLHRLGVTMAEIIHASGETVVLPDTALVDRVLVDAPCTGVGTIRQHPEIMLQFDENRLQSLLKTQQQLLKNAVELLKPGGVLVYSTCSLLAVENQDQITALLTTTPSLILLDQCAFAIQSHGDGFYMAKLQKAGV